VRILCIGDSHSNPVYMKAMFKIAVDFDCDALFQVGDFGYWPANRWGVQFLEECTRLATILGRPLYWIDGNHEDHNIRLDLLDNYHDRFIMVRKNVFYSPRGHSWEWDGVKFMSIGGAYSIRSLIIKQQPGYADEVMELRGKKDGPKEGYFRGLETINDTDVERCKSQGPVDVVFAHDVSDQVPIDLILLESGHARPDARSLEKSRNHRVVLQEAISEANPSLFIHGHYHYPYSLTVDNTKFVGLAHDHWQQRGHEKACFWVVDTLDFRERP
jgi:predicted phosphodiesterase